MIAVSLLAAGVAVGSAFAASGGDTVATAVSFPIGKTVSGPTDEGAGINYFKVAARFGDLLIVGFGVPTQLQSDRDSQGVGACVLPVGTDDFTVGQAHCEDPLERGGSAPDYTYTRIQLTYRIHKNGSYAIAVGSAQCISGRGFSSQNFPCKAFGGKPWRPIPYELRVGLRSYSTMTLSAAKKAIVGQNVTLRGRVNSVKISGARVTVQIHQAARWVRVAKATIAPNGSFSADVPVTRSGRLVFRAIYAGDDRHQPCKAAVALHAT